jgi:hypothetical protein
MNEAMYQEWKTRTDAEHAAWTGRTEQTPNGLATYDGRDFRTYAPQTVTEDGMRTTLQLCEELIEGRWEGFVSIVSRERVA